MMNISNSFNKFYHGVVLNQIWKDNLDIRIEVHNGGDTCIVRRFHPRQVWCGMDEMKQMLKILNPHYPFNSTNSRPVSTTKISNKQLQQHIEWTVSICLDTPEWVQKEWDELKLKAGIDV